MGMPGRTFKACPTLKICNLTCHFTAGLVESKAQQLAVKPAQPYPRVGFVVQPETQGQPVESKAQGWTVVKPEPPPRPVESKAQAPAVQQAEPQAQAVEPEPQAGAVESLNHRPRLWKVPQAGRVEPA